MERDEIKDRVKAAVNLQELISRRGIDLKKAGAEWKALCPFHKEKSPSFSVFFKENQWAFYCHGCVAGGDVFEWIMRMEGVDFPKALTIAANVAGIVIPEAGRRIYQPQEVKEAGSGVQDLGSGGMQRGEFLPEKYRALQAHSVAGRYLTEKRKLPFALLGDYSVGETVDGLAYSFAYKWRPPAHPANRKPLFEFCKVVKVERPEGKKVEWREPKGGKNILFGMCAPIVEAAAVSGGELVICEGEIDAVTWAAYGYAAVSVPVGAKYTGWIDLCWEWLQRFGKIHVSFDEDPAGRLKLVEIVTRLGMARTDIVRLPEKLLVSEQ